MQAVLTDWRTAPVDARLHATLAFLEKMAQPGHPICAEDVAGMRDAGVSDAAIEDAMYVCFCFNVLTRLADAFDFEIITPTQFEKSAKGMLKFGYEITSM